MLPGPVFIGPVAVGKTTVSKLVAAHLDRARVELDEVAMPYYHRCPEFDPARYNRLQATEGFLAAYRYWEPALVFALEQVVLDQPDAVLDLGAGHTSLLNEALHMSVPVTGSLFSITTRRTRVAMSWPARSRSSKGTRPTSCTRPALPRGMSGGICQALSIRFRPSRIPMF